jgi:hypothetical protein
MPWLNIRIHASGQRQTPVLFRPEILEMCIKNFTKYFSKIACVTGSPPKPWRGVCRNTGKVGSGVATSAHVVPNRLERPTGTRQTAKPSFQVSGGPEQRWRCTVLPSGREVWAVRLFLRVLCGGCGRIAVRSSEASRWPLASSSRLSCRSPDVFRRACSPMWVRRPLRVVPPAW